MRFSGAAGGAGNNPSPDAEPAGRASRIFVSVPELELGRSAGRLDLGRVGLEAQMGEDARTASAQRGEAALDRLVEHLARAINDYLKT